MKSTAVGPSNIAFVKYWGRKDEVLRLPANANISFCLDGLTTTTTVEFSDIYPEDDVTIDYEKNEKDTAKISKHLNRVRKLAGISQKAKVVTINNFPSGTGLSSSASGFAALTIAAVAAANLKLSEKDLSILARQGSGSACRSIPDGFVEWCDADTSEESYAYSLFPPEHWNLIDIVAVVSTEKKRVSTSEGQKLAQTSPFFIERSKHIDAKNELAKQLLKEKKFHELGALMEKEALEMHAIMITSTPPLLYWTQGSLKIMKLVQQWREEEHIPVYFTVNTGQDIHLICEEPTKNIVLEKLKGVEEVRKTLVSRPGKGAHLIEDHLF